MLKMLDLRLPSHLLVHGWIMAQDGRKMSKSFNNVIDPLELVNDYGSDLVRYYLTKEFLINTDNDFSLTKMQEIYNNDLANTYGNLVNRFVGMINKYANGKIRFKQETTIDQLTKKMYLQAQVITKQFTKLINEFKMHELLCLILELGYLTNKYIDEAKP
jgi:methionyl-tRNA synthetase